ncbi:MAG: glycosyltransferase family 4 protein [Clostridiales bacterium]|nr:glycosyltransferase family 4 protein [Clostridiales bacterium]
MLKILFSTNVPSPYRVDFFNELGNLCDLTVVFTDRSFKHRDNSWKDFHFKNFRGVFLKGIPFKTNRICFSIKKILNERFDKIIIANFASPTGIIAVKYMNKHKIPYYLEADGGFAGSGKGIKERIKKYIVSGAEGYFSTSEENDKYFIAYGAKKENIIRYPFTSLYASDIIDTPISIEEKLDLRKKLGISEEKVVISVGRFSYHNGYGKGYDVLMRTAKCLNKNIGWYIIGGQPNEEFAKMLHDSGLENFHFIDFKGRAELKEYYYAADTFVLMTILDVWGLVINEAMSCGLPVITTNKCIAGLELVENGENGYIIDVGDGNALAEKIELILTNKELQDQMGKKNIEKIRGYTFENMAKEHIKAFRNY